MELQASKRRVSSSVEPCMTARDAGPASAGSLSWLIVNLNYCSGSGVGGVEVGPAVILLMDPRLSMGGPDVELVCGTLHHSQTWTGHGDGVTTYRVADGVR